MSLLFGGLLFFSITLQADTCEPDSDLEYFQREEPFFGFSVELPDMLAPALTISAIQLATSLLAYSPMLIYQNVSLPWAARAFWLIKNSQKLMTLVQYYFHVQPLLQWALESAAGSESSLAFNEAVGTEAVPYLSTINKGDAFLRVVSSKSEQEVMFSALHSMATSLLELEPAAGAVPLTVTSEDKAMSLQTLHKGCQSAVYAVSINNGGSGNLTFEVGRLGDKYWVSKILSQDISSQVRVAWSHEPDGRVPMTIQFADPGWRPKDAAPVTLRIPEWGVYPLMSKGLSWGTGMLVDRLVDRYLAYHPLKPVTFVIVDEPVETQSAPDELPLTSVTDSGTIVELESNNGVSSCGLQLVCTPTRELFTSIARSLGSGKVPILQAMLSLKQTNGWTSDGDRGGSGSGRGDSAGPPQGGPPGWNNGEGRNGQNGGQNVAPYTPPTDDEVLLRLLGRATKRLLKASGSVEPLGQTYELTRSLSMVGFLQVVPVEGVEQESWPVIMHRKLGEFIQMQLASEHEALNSALKSSSYKIEVTSEFFQLIMAHRSEISRLIQTRLLIYQLIYGAVSQFCSGYRCAPGYMGGEAIRGYFRSRRGVADYFENLPVADDVDVLFPASNPLQLYQLLTSNQMNVAVVGDVGSWKGSYAYPHQHGRAFFNAYNLEFQANGFEKQFLPALDFGMPAQEGVMVRQFQSQDLLVEETIKRGFSPTSPSIVKHEDRLLLLMKAYPSVELFRRLWSDLHKASVGVQTHSSETTTTEVQTDPPASVDTASKSVQTRPEKASPYEPLLKEKEQRVSELEKHLETVQAEIKQQKTLIEELELSEEKATAQEAVWKQWFKEENVGNMEELKQKYLRSKENFDKIRAKAKELKTSNSELEKQLQKLRTEKDSISASKAKIQRQLDEATEELQSQRAAAHLQRTDLQEELKNVQQQLKEIRTELGKSEKEVEKQAKLAKVYKEEIDESSKFKGQYDKASKSNKKLSQQLEAMKVEEQRLKKSLEERDLSHNRALQKLKTGLGLMTVPGIAGTAWGIHYLQQMMKDRGWCQGLESENIRTLCLSFAPLEPEDAAFLKALDDMPDEYRVISYGLFSVDYQAGTVTRARMTVPDKNERILTRAEGRNLVLAKKGHFRLGTLSELDLLNIYDPFYQAWIKRKGRKAEDIPGFVKAMINYCGVMPDAKWQSQCVSQADQRLYSSELPPEETETLAGRDIQLQESEHVLSFLPVWKVTSGRLLWETVWPYRLDRRGYSLLGNHREVIQYAYRCPLSISQMEVRIFTKLRWDYIGTVSCRPGVDQVFNIGSRDPVIWGLERRGDHLNSFAESPEGSDEITGAWERKDR